MDLAVLPERRRPAHDPRGHDLAQRRAVRREQRRRHPRRLPPRRGGPAEHRAAAGLRRQEAELGLPLLLAAAGHPGRRPGHARTSTRETHRSPASPADFEPFKGVIRLSRFRYVAGEIGPAPSSRSSTCRSTAASAATWAATSSSTPRATCCSPPVTTPTRSRPTATCRSTSGPTVNPAFDAQRSSANTNDLRGKVLRITPEGRRRLHHPRAATCSAPGTAKTRPEIYAMGLRNPFRIEIDPRTDAVLRGRLLTRRAHTRPRRGPAGQGSGSRSTKPANYGWPYCATAELPYVDYDFATGTSGEEFDCCRAGQRVTAQHRADRAAARRPSRRLVLLRPVGGVPRARDRRHRADGRSGVRLRRSHGAQPAARRVAPPLRRHAALLRVDPRLREGHAARRGR